MGLHPSLLMSKRFVQWARFLLLTLCLQTMAFAQGSSGRMRVPRPVVEAQNNSVILVIQPTDRGKDAVIVNGFFFEDGKTLIIPRTPSYSGLFSEGISELIVLGKNAITPSNQPANYATLTHPLKLFTLVPFKTNFLPTRPSVIFLTDPIPGYTGFQVSNSRKETAFSVPILTKYDELFDPTHYGFTNTWNRFQLLSPESDWDELFVNAIPEQNKGDISRRLSQETENPYHPRNAFRLFTAQDRVNFNTPIVDESGHLLGVSSLATTEAEEGVFHHAMLCSNILKKLVDVARGSIRR